MSEFPACGETNDMELVTTPGGASIASGYTPDALAGAGPGIPPAPKGEKGVKCRRKKRRSSPHG